MRGIDLEFVSTVQMEERFGDVIQEIFQNLTQKLAVMQPFKQKL